MEAPLKLECASEVQTGMNARVFIVIWVLSAESVESAAKKGGGLSRGWGASNKRGVGRMMVMGGDQRGNGRIQEMQAWRYSRPIRK